LIVKKQRLINYLQGSNFNAAKLALDFFTSFAHKPTINFLKNIRSKHGGQGIHQNQQGYLQGMPPVHPHL
jgi:hypothetical protein